MLAAALLLASLAHGELTDKNRFGYEEVSLLGWNDACAVALRHLRYPPSPEGGPIDPEAGRIGAVALAPDSTKAAPTWTLIVKEGTLWDRGQAAAAQDAMARAGFTRSGYRERLYKEPVVGGLGIETLASTASLRIGYQVSIPTAPYSLVQIDYSPLGTCAFLLYEKPGHPPNLYRYQLARVPLDARRKRAQAHLNNGLLLYRKGNDIFGALAEVEIAAAMDPRLGDARYHHAALLAVHGRFEEALAELREAVLLDEKYARMAKEAVEFDDLKGPRLEEVLKPPKGLIPIER